MGVGRNDWELQQLTLARRQVKAMNRSAREEEVWGEIEENEPGHVAGAVVCYKRLQGVRLPEG